jgi:hypothetical protein
VLTNPEVEWREQPLNVLEVYIDTDSTYRELLERFITFIINYPPKHGVKSVKIFYKGDLDNLGENLKNALRNTFDKIEQIV